MIKTLKEVAKESFKTLKSYQQGTIRPVPTGRPWLDDVFGGLLPGDIVTVAGASGAGKSFEEQRLKNNIMSLTKVPESKDFIWLGYSLEMRYLSTLIRGLKEITGKSKKKILTEEFSKEEKGLANDYYNNATDGRFFIEEEVLTAEQFNSGLFSFLEANKHKAAIFISIDHIGLFKGMDPKKTIDTIVQTINEARKLYKNTYWLILSQFNRLILGRIQERNMNAKPNRGDVFQSDTMFFLSDYLYVPHNPYNLGIKEFLKVRTKQYAHLIEHFSEIKNGSGSFTTVGKMFYIVLKLREGGVVFKDIYIEDVNEVDKELYAEPKDMEIDYETPAFSSTTMTSARDGFDDF